MSFQQHFHALSNDFGNLFNSQKFSDIRIIVGEAPDIRTFYAHSQILAARSPYFAVALSSNWIKRENNIIIFPKPNISPKIFEIILRYIYNGEISLDKHGVPTILELLVTADELILENIIDHLEDYLIENRAKELEENFATLQKTSFMHDSFKKILPGTLYEDLLHHYLVPGSHQKSVDAQPLRLTRSNIDTKLLKSQNIQQLDHWIQGKDDNTPFGNQLENNFKLLLRGSRDGFTPADFHRLCDDKGATVSVIKVKGTGQIIGDFNPQSWHSRNEYLEGKGSFIFSLGDDKTENAILSKFFTGYGPFGGANCGPYFGLSNIKLCGKDLKNSSDCYCQYTGHYEHALLGSNSIDI
ncbi:hypothetical protein G9A89_002522 [Geosiphon pyriformis]|nr:hypothetical protein G9A89_002522 [Geosiphon pyriformis]